MMGLRTLTMEIATPVYKEHESPKGPLARVMHWLAMTAWGKHLYSIRATPLPPS